MKGRLTKIEERLNVILLTPCGIWTFLQYKFAIESNIINLLIISIFTALLIFEVRILKQFDNYNVVRLLGFYGIIYLGFILLYQYSPDMQSEFTKIQLYVFITFLLKLFSASKPFKSILQNENKKRPL